MSGRSLEGVWKVSRGCLEGVWRLSEGVCRVSVVYLLIHFIHIIEVKMLGRKNISISLGS